MSVLFFFLLARHILLEYLAVVELLAVEFDLPLEEVLDELLVLRVVGVQLAPLERLVVNCPVNAQLHTVETRNENEFTFTRL